MAILWWAWKRWALKLFWVYPHLSSKSLYPHENLPTWVLRPQSLTAASKDDWLTSPINKSKLTCQWDGLLRHPFLLLQITSLRFKNGLPETLPATQILPPKGDGSNGKTFRLGRREAVWRCRILGGAGPWGFIVCSHLHLLTLGQKVIKRLSFQRITKTRPNFLRILIFRYLH